MPTFTVHAPPLRPGDTTDPERFVFIRDGFYVWAFLLAPLWLLVHRLWLALLGYVVVSAIVGALVRLAGLPDAADFLIGFFIALLIGLEAPTLWRWTLARKRWTTAGFVVGDDLEEAEHRFFAGWSARNPAAQPPAPVKPSAPVWRGAPAPSDVIGLFPEPGGKP